MSTKVFIADNCAVTRLATRYQLEAQKDIEVVGESDDGIETVKLVEQCRPDVVLTELSLQGRDGLESITALRETHPAVKIIVLTSWNQESDAVKAMSMGADGFCCMDNSHDLNEVMKVVLDGGRWIDPQLCANNVVKRFLPKAS